MDDLGAAARAAWLYSLPLIEMARVRSLAAKAASVRGGINSFMHSRALATPDARAVTSPNVDTLYSSAFIDLGNGPASVTLPSTGNRYFSLQLLDMYTNNVAVLGTRTIGGAGGRFTLTGPGFTSGADAVRVPTPWLWALARIGVDDPDALEEAHRIQDGIILEAHPPRAVGEFAHRNADWAAYFTSAAALLAENPPPAADQPLFQRIAPLGLDPAHAFDTSRFTAAERQEVGQGVAEARQFLETIPPVHGTDGWVYPPADLGIFGQRYVFRARVALMGLAALPCAEAMYMTAVTPGGTTLFDQGDWRLHFASGQFPPVAGFWSLTMYEATRDRQFFLTENPLHRYAIGDRTKGLAYNSDGSLDIWISRRDPGPEKTANWLPAPAAGPFRLSLRAYLPKPALLDGTYRLPPLTSA